MCFKNLMHFGNYYTTSPVSILEGRPCFSAILACILSDIMFINGGVGIQHSENAEDEEEA